VKVQQRWQEEAPINGALGCGSVWSLRLNTPSRRTP